MSNGIGSIRPSQIITSFGSGSIVDLTHDSVMILATENWTPGNEVSDFRLQHLLQIDKLCSPMPRKGIPVRSFPKWRVCPRCGALSDSFPRPREKQVPVCNRCGGEVATHPARFVIACDRGHISDFPWVLWAHRGRKTCQDPVLTLRARNYTGALSDLEVHCKCGARQSLYGALGPKGIASVLQRCPGERPWIGDREPNCQGVVRGLQRGASNVYFPLVASSLSIPPWTTGLQAKLDKFWPAIKSIAEHTPDLIPTVVPKMLPDENPEAILEAVNLRLMRSQFTDLRTEEWATLTGADSGIEADDFSAVSVPVPLEFSKWIRRVVQVRRLREVRALCGFTRVDPPDPELQDKRRLAPLSGSQVDWLPAVEVRGEGIFVQLDPDMVARWEKLDCVQRRTRPIIEAYNTWRSTLGWPTTRKLLPRDILVHTLSHMLIKQLALDAGYSAASVRERLYSSPTMCGFLLYTAAPGADGSLGGLIQQSSPARFAALMRGALDSARVCTSDPLCREHTPSEKTGVNGAACHACALAPETSCERSNRLLDRACVVDLPEIEGSGYFSWNG